MPDPVLAPWGILFDPDGRKTDELLHGDGDQEVPDPDPQGSPYGGGGGGVPADPGGYYEEPNALGMLLGMQRTWHNYYDGPDLYGDAAQLEASKWIGDVPEPG